MESLTALPRARNEQLVVQMLPEETLVYDLRRHKAHCLNKTAAFVWQYCDGQTSATDLAEKLNKEFSLPADEKIVWLAVNDLAKAHLLEGTFDGSAGVNGGRRAALKRIGVLGASAVLLPTIISMVAPKVSASVSCGQPCIPGDPQFDCAQPCVCLDIGEGQFICVDQSPGATKPDPIDADKPL